MSYERLEKFKAGPSKFVDKAADEISFRYQQGPALASCTTLKTLNVKLRSEQIRILVEIWKKN
jgi:hypothetical protein